MAVLPGKQDSLLCGLNMPFHDLAAGQEETTENKKSKSTILVNSILSICMCQTCIPDCTICCCTEQDVLDSLFSDGHGAKPIVKQHNREKLNIQKFHCYIENQLFSKPRLFIQMT